MKALRFLPGLLLIGLAACGQQMSPADAAIQTSSASSQDALGGQDESLSAEEIQQRRSKWLSGSAGMPGAPTQVAHVEAAGHDESE